MSKYYKIITSLFLVVFFVSTTGVVLNKHLCGNSIKNVAAFTKAEACDHSEKQKAELPPCHTPEKQQQEEDCCEDETKEIKNNEQTLNYTKIQLDIYNSVLYFILPLILDFTKDNIQNSISFVSESPPVSEKFSLHKLFERFII